MRPRSVPSMDLSWHVDGRIHLHAGVISLGEPAAVAGLGIRHSRSSCEVQDAVQRDDGRCFWKTAARRAGCTCGRPARDRWRLRRGQRPSLAPSAPARAPPGQLSAHIQPLVSSFLPPVPLRRWLLCVVLPAEIPYAPSPMTCS